MRKAIKEGMKGTMPFNISALENLQNKGYNFVQIKGFTLDNHYEYIDPFCLVLVPLIELPVEQFRKDIYEPIKSELLYKWAAEVNEHPQIVIASK